MKDPRRQEDDNHDNAGHDQDTVESGDLAETADSATELAAESDAGADAESGDENDAEELSPEDLLRQERDAFQEKWLRVVAELDNVRKRSRREVSDTRRLSQADVLRAFLEMYDNFERALQAPSNENDTEPTDGLRDGIEMIFQNFRRILRDRDVEVIDALDTEFDPAVHEAVGQLAREGVEPGVVVEILQQGFKMGDLVLRPARVMISS